MKRNVLMDGNGSDTVMIEGLGPYVSVSQVRSLQAEVERQKDAACERDAYLEQREQQVLMLEQERDQLKSNIAELYGVFGVGSSCSFHILKTNIENAKRFSEYLTAVEHEFFMRPGEPDEEYPDDEPEPVCILNSFGAESSENYVEQFRKALLNRDTEVIERFKDELVKSVSVLYRPHIEGVCAVVQQRIRQQAQEVQLCS